MYTEVPLEQVAEMAQQVNDEPMKCRLNSPMKLLRRYHGAEVADWEQAWFLQTFSARQTPVDSPEILVEPGAQTAFALVKRFFGSQKSHGELRRLFEQGAISLNGQAIRQAEQVVEIRDGDVFRVGKRTWFRLQVDDSRVIE